MDFNESTYWTCCIVTSFSLLLHVTGRKTFSIFFGSSSPSHNGSLAGQSGSSSASGGPAVRNSDYLKFRRRFSAPYLLCLFAESLQQPYLYHLFHSYGHNHWQIALLYAFYVSARLCGQFVCAFALRRLDRKLLCCVFAALSSMGCVLKFSSNFNWLVCSRLVDGFAASLVATPFQEWYANEHMQDFDFPKDWIPVTFGFVAILSKYAAVGSGFLAEFVEDAFKITLFPFLLAIPIFIAAGTYISFKWPNSLPNAFTLPGDGPSSSSNAHADFFSRLKSGCRLLCKNSNILLLCMYQTFMETTSFLLAFLWTPIFAHLTRIYSSRPAYGGLFSCLAASALLGFTVGRLLVGRKFNVSSVLSFASGLSLIGSVLAVTSCYPEQETRTQFQVALVGLCTVSMGIGLYATSYPRAYGELVPFDLRHYVHCLFKIPDSLLIILLLTTISLSEYFASWLLVVVCMILSLLALMTSFALQGTVKKYQMTAADHVTFEVKGSESYDLQ